MKRELPIIKIEDTDFIVDVNKFELREKNNPKNKYSVFDMLHVEGGYVFELRTDWRNPPTHSSPAVKRMIKIPEMVRLDPVGMAKKCKLKIRDLSFATDLSVMVNRKAMENRFYRGMLPTLDIAGHTFYVDVNMDKLRPKDDFISNGIEFSKIENYYDHDTRMYTIPYNPQKKEFAEIEYANLKEFPKNLIAVSFPSERLLDRVGWNRKYGFDVMNGILRGGLKMNFKAQVIPWEKTYLAEIIESNIRQEKRKQEKMRLENKPAELQKQQNRSI